MDKLICYFFIIQSEVFSQQIWWVNVTINAEYSRVKKDVLRFDIGCLVRVWSTVKYVRYWLSYENLRFRAYISCLQQQISKIKLPFAGQYILMLFRTMWTRDCDVVLVGRTIDLGKPQGAGKLEWGGNGEAMGREGPVHEQPGTRVDGIAPHKRRDSK